MVFSTRKFAARFGWGAIKAAAIAGLLGVSACQGALDGLNVKAEKPVSKKLVRKMKAKGMRSRAPIMVRIFKQENTLEIWKATHTGRYALLADYEICKWSGKLGPKFKEGDKQAPEGFYTVNPYQMNPKSKYHLAFNMGFPNAYDRAHGRTGSHLMIHGACSSAGCYSMTDERVQDIYSLARDAFKGGQRNFQIQAFPFRMTPKNLARHANSRHFEFWKMLKEGYDHFELTKIPPKVATCGRRYQFNVQAVDNKKFVANAECPQMGVPKSLATAYMKRKEKQEQAFEMALARRQGRRAKNLPPMTYATAFPGMTIIGAVPDKVEPVAPKEAETAPATVEKQGEKPTKPESSAAQPTTTTAPSLLPLPSTGNEIPAEPVVTGTVKPTG